MNNRRIHTLHSARERILRPVRFAAFRYARVIALTVAAMLVGIGTAPAQSETGSLNTGIMAGFDETRLHDAYPPANETAASDLSRIVYRLRRIDPAVLANVASTSTDAGAVGDMITAEGTITKIRRLKVPDRLQEFLDLTQLQEISLSSGESDSSIVITAGLPTAAVPGDRIRSVGVALRTEPTIVASGKVSWFPTKPPSVGWKLLSDHGADVSLLAEIAQRNQKPLGSEDATAFYDVTAAAAKIGEQLRENDAAVPAPDRVGSVQLLRDPSKQAGRWIQIDVETVQITRVAVTDPAREKQLGRDHYFQIDAIGSLPSNVVVVIKPEESEDEGEQSEPARFENRFPISIVTRDLPPFLSDAMAGSAGEGAVVAEISMPVRIDGFFFRLWSYETEYMRRLGGREQHGPLVMAARIVSMESSERDPVGVRVIGWIAAAAILTGLIATILWTQVTSRGDADIRHQRGQEPKQLNFPDELID